MAPTKKTSKNPNRPGADKQYLIKIEREQESENPNYYRLFGLLPTKDIDQQIKPRVVGLASQFITIIEKTGGSKPKKDQWRKFVEEARDTLLDPESKAKYDAERSQKGGKGEAVYDDTEMEDYSDGDQGEDESGQEPPVKVEAPFMPVELVKQEPKQGDPEPPVTAQPSSILLPGRPGGSVPPAHVDGMFVEDGKQDDQKPPVTAQFGFTPPPGRPGGSVPSLFAPRKRSRPGEGSENWGSVDTWDSPYSSFPRSERDPKMILIAWQSNPKMLCKDRAFVMTPQGLDCVKPNQLEETQFDAFKEDARKKYLTDYDAHSFKGVFKEMKDAWSPGNGSEDSYPQVVCLLEFKENIFKVMSMTAASKFNSKLRSEALRRCREKGVLFTKDYGPKAEHLKARPAGGHGQYPYGLGVPPQYPPAGWPGPYPYGPQVPGQYPPAGEYMPQASRAPLQHPIPGHVIPEEPVKTEPAGGNTSQTSGVQSQGQPASALGPQSHGSGVPGQHPPASGYMPQPYGGPAQYPPASGYMPQPYGGPAQYPPASGYMPQPYGGAAQYPPTGGYMPQPYGVPAPYQPAGGVALQSPQIQDTLTQLLKGMKELIASVSQLRVQ